METKNSISIKRSIAIKAVVTPTWKEDAEKELNSGSHPGYPYGKVTFKRTSFFINENERSNLEIVCFDIAEELNIRDRLTIDLKSKEYNEWLVELYR